VRHGQLTPKQKNVSSCRLADVFWQDGRLFNCAMKLLCLELYAERRMSCRLLIGEDGSCCRRQGWCHQRSMSVPDQTTTGAVGWQLCIPLIAGQEDSARYGHIVQRRRR